MTPDDEKRIRDEEIFREQVRGQLDRLKPKTCLNRAFDVLNSNFAIFLLSAIVLGGTSTLVTYCADQRKQDQQMISMLRKLHVEVDHRLEILERLNREEFKYSNYLDAMAALTGNPDFVGLHGAKSNFYPLFSEFKGRSVAELFFRQKSASKSDSESEMQSRINLARQLQLVLLPEYLEPVKNDSGGREDSELSWSLDTTDRQFFSRLVGNLFSWNNKFTDEIVKAQE